MLVSLTLSFPFYLPLCLYLFVFVFVSVCVFVFDSVFMMRSHRSPGRPLMTMPSITLMETLQGVQGHNRTKKHQSPRKPQINQNAEMEKRAHSADISVLFYRWLC